ncbi:MAG: type II toxin-antitoxin system RelE family toxin [Candidatus Hadarchaeia archaeon]
MTNSFELTRAPKFDETLEMLPEETQERILKKLKEFDQQVNEYSIDPRQHGSTKYISEKRVWRLRIGDYRAFFDILGDEIKFLVIRHRKDAYKK